MQLITDVYYHNLCMVLIKIKAVGIKKLYNIERFLFLWEDTTHTHTDKTLITRFLIIPNSTSNNMYESIYNIN